MNFDFNSAVAIKTLSTNSIRIKAMEQLELAKETLKAEATELKEKFNDLTEEELKELEEQREPEFLDSLIFDFAILGPLSGFFAGNFAIFEAFNAFMAVSCADAYDIARQESDDPLEGRLYDYPFGRAQFMIGSSVEEAEEDFNLASKKLRLGTGATPKAEKNRMYDVLSMLNKLEKQGVHHVEVSEKSSMLDSLKSLTKDLSGYNDVFTAAPAEKFSYMVA